MRILRAKLFEVEQKKQEEKMGGIHAQKKAIEWGSQIRSYVLAPYRLVNDHRTGLKVSNVDAVLDGDLDEFMIAQLLQLAGDPSAGACKAVGLRRTICSAVTETCTFRIHCGDKLGILSDTQALAWIEPVDGPWIDDGGRTRADR